MALKITGTINQPSNVNWMAMIYGTLIAVIVSILLMAIGGTVMFYTASTDRVIPVIGLGILFVSVFVGGLTSARRAGKIGWLHGLAVGFLFLVLTVIFSMIFPGGIFGFPVLKKIVASVVAGSLGGIWGVGQGY